MTPPKTREAAEKAKGWEAVLWTDIIEATDRFWLNVEKTDSCWIWNGALSGGYGLFSIKGKLLRAHRIAFSLNKKSPVNKEKTIDHLCNNKRCVNPQHLEAVSPRTNTLRGDGPSSKNAKKETCIRGHVFTMARNRASGGRACRECKRLNDRLSYRKRRNVPAEKFRGTYIQNQAAITREETIREVLQKLRGRDAQERQIDIGYEFRLYKAYQWADWLESELNHGR